MGERKRRALEPLHNLLLFENEGVVGLRVLGWIVAEAADSASIFLLCPASWRPRTVVM